MIFDKSWFKDINKLALTLDTLNDIEFDIDKLSIDDIKNVVNVKDIEKVFSELKTISEADYGDFGALKIQESATAVSALSAELQASSLSLNGFSEAEINAVLSANGLADSQIEQAVAFAQTSGTIELYNSEIIKAGLQNTALSTTEQKLILDKLGLVDATTGELISTKQVSKAKLEEALVNTGLEASEAAVTAERIISITTQGAQTASMEAMLILTKKQIAANLKYIASMVAAHPVATALAASIGLVAVGVRHNNKAQKEAVEHATEAATAYTESSSSIESYTKKYEALREQLILAKGNEEETYNVKKQLLELQNELNEKFGEEYGRINLVTDAYKDQTEAIKNLNKESANTFLNEEREGIRKSAKEMTKERKYALSGANISLDTAEGKELKEIIESYEKDGMYLIEENGGSTVQINLRADAQNAYDTISAFSNDVREKAKELGDEHLFDSILNLSSNSLNKAKDVIDEYGEVYRKSLAAEIVTDDKKSEVYNEALTAVEEYNEAILRSNDPYNDENVAKAKANLDSIKDKIAEGGEEWSKYSPLMDDIFDQADTRLIEFNEKLKNDESLTKDAKSLIGLSDLDLKSFGSGENEAFDRLKESAKNAGLEVNELIDLLVQLGYIQGEISSNDVEIAKWDFKDTVKNLDAAKEKLSVLDETFSKLFDNDKKTNIGYEDYSAIADAFSNVSGIDNYITKLQEAGQNTEQVTAVMQDLIGAYLKESKILENVTDDNKDLIITMLEEMGVANAEQIVLAQLSHKAEMLAIQKQFVTEKGYELANATAAEITEFLNETECSDVTKQALAQLALEKINVNNQKIDTSADIDNIIALANTAMAGEAALAKLRKAKEVIATVEQYGALNVARYRAGITTAQYNEAKAIMESIENGTFDYDFQAIDPNKYKATGSAKYTPTYSPQKTPGTSTYESLEKANDAMKKSKKVIDFFEERIKKLNNALELLELNLENVTGAFAKNNLIDAQIGLNSEKINNYTDALAMYTQKANEALSKLPSDIANKLKNGSVSVTTFIGEGNEEVTEAISEYTEWADKIADCQKELAGLKEAIRDLELAKFNNIMQDFTDQFDLHEGSKDLIDKQIDLFKEAGQLIGESFYAAQIDQTKKQLALLEEEKKKLSEQMTSAVTSGRVEIGTDEWLEMVNALKDVEGSILDAKTALEEFDNELLNLHTEIFNRIQDQFNNLHSELQNLEGLFDDFDVSDGEGNWSKEGLTRLGLLAQKLELSRYQIEQYNDEIDLLNKQYAEGRYSATEYSDKLAELSQAQWECVNSSESIKDAIIELNQARIDEEIEGIEEEIDKFSELIEAQKEALQSRKELEDYKRQIADKTKSIDDLERQIAAMQNDTSASTVAKRKLLEQQLADARRDLEDTEREHSYNSQVEALDKELENYQKEKDAEIEALRQSLEDREALIFNSMETVKQNSSIVGEELKNMAEYHGITISDAIITSWQNGENAIASYGAVLSAGSSAFIGNIIGVENEVYALQNQANVTADSLAWMFATRADNLVGQLTDSYYSEANLNAMTNALNESLMNTLERGYNIDGITGALNDIASGLSNVADQANRTAQAIQNAIGAQNELSRNSLLSVETSIDKNGKATYNVVDWSGGKKTIISSHITQSTAENEWRRLNGYASGVRTLDEDQLAWTQEYGSEMILSPTRNAVLTPLKQGDTVLTKAQTDAIYEWSKLNPNTFVPNGMKSMLSNASKIQPITNSSSPTLEFNGTLMHIDKVDSTNIKQMENIANKAVDRLVTQMSDGIRYRSM